MIIVGILIAAAAVTALSLSTDGRDMDFGDREVRLAANAVYARR